MVCRDHGVVALVGQPMQCAVMHGRAKSNTSQRVLLGRNEWVVVCYHCNVAAEQQNLVGLLPRSGPRLTLCVMDYELTLVLVQGLPLWRVLWDTTCCVMCIQGGHGHQSDYSGLGGPARQAGMQPGYTLLADAIA